MCLSLSPQILKKNTNPKHPQSITSFTKPTNPQCLTLTSKS